MHKTPFLQQNGNQPIHAVIFDLDGVLMDSEWLAFTVWRDLASQYGGALAETAFPEMIGTTAEQTAEIVMRSTGVAYDIPQSVTWAWQQVNLRLKTDIDALPGAHELVRDLSARGLPLAIASNSPTMYIDDALTGLKLLAYFPLRVGIDQVLQGKPSPDLYLRAAKLLGARPENCLAIEDSRVGVDAAVAAGMRVLAVPNERDLLSGFNNAWRIYPSLLKIRKDLDEILA